MSSRPATAADGTYALLADLTLEIDAYTVAPLAQRVAPEVTRRTTVVTLCGTGEEGVGEDVTPTEYEQVVFAEAPPLVPLAGSFTLKSFSEHLDELDLFPAPPPRFLPRTFRRWAFESAALDLALRQAGRSLASVLQRDPQPVRFVNSLRLPRPPTIAPLRQRLGLQPALRFKLDPTSDWDDELIERLAETASIAILDLKGRYPPQAPIAMPPDPSLYARVASAFPNAWLEDPALTPQTDEVLRAHQDRITWDAPIHATGDIDRQPFPAGAINVKPARIGTLRRLLELYDYCDTAAIPTYGGGMFELGPGRGQLQYLASLFHGTAPNDVAPTEYNRPELASGAATSPLAPTPASSGFQWESTPGQGRPARRSA